MGLDEFHLKNDKRNKHFFFRAVAPVRNNKSQPVMDVPLISTSPQNTFLFRIFGQSEEITFTFAIYDDGTDASFGDNIITVNQQIQYLKDEIYSPEYDAGWILINQRYAPSPGVNCVITNLEFDNAAGGEKIVTGSISLRRGRIGLGTGIIE